MDSRCTLDAQCRPTKESYITSGLPSFISAPLYDGHSSCPLQIIARDSRLSFSPL